MKISLEYKYECLPINSKNFNAHSLLSSMTSASNLPKNFGFGNDGKLSLIRDCEYNTFNSK